jgi:hypothetical protein
VRSFPRTVFVFDLTICALFAVPGLSGFVVDSLAQVNSLIGWPGGSSGHQNVGAFFVNFAGLLGVLLNIALLDPRQRTLHWSNVYARALVVLLLTFHVRYSGLPAIYLLFAGTEVIGGLITLRWLRRPVAAAERGDRPLVRS